MIILKIQIADFAISIFDPESHPPIPRNVKTPYPFPTPCQKMRFPHRHRPELACLLHRFKKDNHFSQFVDNGRRQSPGIVFLRKAFQALMEKVPYFHNSSVACRFTLVNFRNGNGRVESVRHPHSGAESDHPLQSRPSQLLCLECPAGQELRLSFSQRLKEIREGFEPAFWVANISEIFERLAYYGAFSSLANYLHESLNIPTEQTGSLTGWFGGMVWFLAILGGAVADRLGFRRALSSAYLILACAYFLLGSLGTAWMAPVRSAVPLLGLVAFILFLPALGISMVKPSVVGTTARASRENVRSIGYSIYYTLVNIGGAAGPYIASWAHRHLGVENVFRVSALSVLLMFFAVLLFFKEPRRSGEVQTVSLAETASKLIHGSDESALHDLSADFLRILDCVLAGIHRVADLRSRVHRSACRC